MRTFEELIVWKRSHLLVMSIYERTRSFPPEERFGLTSQLRRAAVSVPANLAEGCKRSSRSDFARHVAIARASASEVDYLVYLSTALGYVEESVSHELRRELDEIQRMLTALYRGLNVDN
jgi:four helix bundle protein